MSANTDTAFLAHLGKLTSASAVAVEMGAQIIVDIVAQVRDSAGPNGEAIIAIDDKGEAITYADVLNYARGVTQDTAAFFNRVIALTPKGADVLARLEADTKRRDTLLKRAKAGALLMAEHAELNALAGPVKPGTSGRDRRRGSLFAIETERNALVQTLGRAFRASAYIIEAADYVGHTWQRDSIERKGKLLFYTGPTGDMTKKGEAEIARMQLMIVDRAETFRDHYAKWTAPATAPVEATTGEVVESSDTPAPADKPAVSDTPKSRAANRKDGKASELVAYMATDKGLRVAADAMQSALARRGDNKPDGDTRDAMLGLMAALLHVFTVEDVAAWEKENAAAPDAA